MNPVLMPRVEGAEITRDGDSVHLVLDLVHLGQDAWQVKRPLFPPVEVVSPVEKKVVGRDQAPLHIERGDQVGVVADEQQSDPFSLALGDGVGGQSGRDGHHAYGRWIVDLDAVDDPLDTDGKVALGGQAFLGG